ncbi:DUF2156 domain-containing protein [bacterium]|nr:DUF2156 domain-containing protein [bacterium]
MLNFRDITLEDRDLFASVINNYYCVHDSFIYWYAWGGEGKIQFAEDEEALYLKTFYTDSEGRFLAPYLKDRSRSIRGPLEKVRQLTGDINYLWVPEVNKNIIERDCPDMMEFTLSRDFSEYIYNVADLIKLEGHVYRGKRNRIRSFLRRFSNMIYLPYEDKYKFECLNLDRDWQTDKDEHELILDEEHESRNREYFALKRVLDNFEILGAKGCVILDGDRANRIAGFSVGSQLNAEMADIHFEKCHPDYRDMYAYLRHEFLSHCWSHMPYVNCEEDMGDQGLRTSKLSYNPVKLAKQYVAKWK